MARTENKNESQKTAEFLREAFKGKTIKTVRRHKNDKYVTLVFTDGAKLIFDNDVRLLGCERRRCRTGREAGSREGSLTALTGRWLPVAGLWWDAKGDWTMAHESAQQEEGPDGSWVHAYLHRKEGDPGNAAYWYRRAGKPMCREQLDVEWESVVRELLRKGA